MGVPADAGIAASGRSPYRPDDKANYVVQGALAAVGPGKPGTFNGPLNLSIWAQYTTSLAVTAGSLTATTGGIGVIAAGTAISATVVPEGTTVATLPGVNDVTIALPIRTVSGRTANGVASITGLYDTSWLLGSTVTGLGIPGSTTVTAIAVVAIPAAGILGEVTLSADVTATTDNQQTEPFEFALHEDGLTTASDSAAIYTGAAIVFSATLQLERSFNGAELWVPCNIGGSGSLAQWSAGTPVSLAFGEPEQNVYYRLNALVFGAQAAGTTVQYRMSETGQAARSLSIPTL